MYVYKIVTSTLRPRKGVPHRARRIKKDSQSKPHFKHEPRESKKKKMRGWTTSDVKKIKNLIKTFWSETFSYLQLFNNKEL